MFYLEDDNNKIVYSTSSANEIEKYLINQVLILENYFEHKEEIKMFEAENRKSGFHGTLKKALDISDGEAAILFDMAGQVILSSLDREDESVRDDITHVLDSRHAGNFVDELTSETLNTFEILKGFMGTPTFKNEIVDLYEYVFLR